MFCVFANLLSAQGPTSESKELQKDSKKIPKKAPRQVFFRRAEKTLVCFLKNVSKRRPTDPPELPGAPKKRQKVAPGEHRGVLKAFLEPQVGSKTSVFSALRKNTCLVPQKRF